MKTFVLVKDRWGICQTMSAGSTPFEDILVKFDPQLSASELKKFLPVEGGFSPRTRLDSYRRHLQEWPDRIVWNFYRTYGGTKVTADLIVPSADWKSLEDGYISATMCPIVLRADWEGSITDFIKKHLDGIPRSEVPYAGHTLFKLTEAR